MVEHRLWFFHTISFSATFGIEDSKSVFQFICETRKPPQRSKIFLATENTPLPTTCRGREDTEKKEKVRREMIRAFGRTIGRMHAKNIFHGDLRLNNVLLRREGGNWRFFFLDNERTKKFNKLPLRRRIQNLVQINMTPAEVMGKTDRMRFFKEYRAQTGTGKEKGKVLIAATIKGTIRRLQKQRKNRREPRKVQRTKGGNLWIETGNFRAMFSKVFPFSEEAPDFIENLERLIRAGQILREERNCIVSQIRWKDKEVVVKQYVPRGLIHSLKNTIWKSPAKQDWLNGHRLKMPNTAANKPLAYIERLKSGLIWKSYFVTEHNEL